MYSRTPTPEVGVRASPGMPGKSSTPSKVPVRLSSSQGQDDDDDDDDEDDDDEESEDAFSPGPKARVSFSDRQDIRNIVRVIPEDIVFKIVNTCE